MYESLLLYSKMYKYFLTINKNIVEYSKKSSTELNKLFYSLTFVIIIRTFLEMLFEETHTLIFYRDFHLNLVSYGHIYISWLCVFLTFTIVFSIFLKVKLIESFRIIVVFSPIILIPPIFDFLFYGYKGGHIYYGFNLNDFLYNYSNCFNPFVELQMVSRGVRLEVLFIVVSSFYIASYVFKISLVRAITLAFLSYNIVFFYGYLPAIYNSFGINFYSLSGISVTGISIPQKFLFMYLIIFIILCLAILFLLSLQNIENLNSIISFLYPSRLIFYLLLLFMGYLFVGVESNLYPKILNFEDLLKLSSAAISIIFLFMYAKILNDICDLNIDKFSNIERPIVKKILSLQTAESLKNIFLIPSLIFAISTDMTFLFYWLFIFAASYLYSSSPIRIRRFYPFGHLLLSLIGISVFISGGGLVKPVDVYLIVTKKNLLIYLFFAYFFIAHIKDYKDIVGDRNDGVTNIFNYIKFKKLAGMFFIFGYAFCLFKIGNILEIKQNLMIILLLMFLFSSLIYSIIVKENVEKLDKILLFALITSLGLAILWLLKITNPSFQEGLVKINIFLVLLFPLPFHLV